MIISVINCYYKLRLKMFNDDLLVNIQQNFIKPFNKSFGKYNLFIRMQTKNTIIFKVYCCFNHAQKFLTIGHYPKMSIDQALAVAEIIYNRVKAGYINIDEFVKLHYDADQFKFKRAPRKKYQKKKTNSKYGTYKKKYDALYPSDYLIKKRDSENKS